MGVPLATLELLSKGKPVKTVKEGQSVSLMVNALKRLDGVSLWLGELELRKVPIVDSNTSVGIEFTFPDYIGENRILLKDVHGSECSNTLEVFVRPATMDYSEFERLRDEHIPNLIQSAGAEDTAAQSYPGATPALEEDTINFNISLLLEFSKELLGVTRRVLELLSYHIITERKKLKGHLRGNIRWQKTAVMRAQKGVDAATTHVSDIRRRQWNTPTNLLLVRFHMEVFMEALFFRDEIDRREREKKAWAAIYDTPYEGLDPEMAQRMETLEAVLKVHKEVLSNIKLKPLILEAKELRKESEVFRRQAPEEARRTKNRSYRDLIDLWQRFLDEYESYYEDVVQIHTRRMRDFYALWVAAEIAGALKLRASLKSLRQFHSASRDIVLRYDAPGQIRQGWSDSILEMLFDEGDGSDGEYKKKGGGGPELFLHYKGLDLYLEARYDLRSRPKPDDVYKVLAFMSNYEAPCGLILYPGPRLKLTFSREQGQVMAWIPFGPRSNIYEIAPEYLKFAVENVADLYRFMAEGKPVEKLARLIEEAAADFYQTGGATNLPETERWTPPPEEEEEPLLAGLEPTVSPEAMPEIEAEPPTDPTPPEAPKPEPPAAPQAVEGPFTPDQPSPADEAEGEFPDQPPEPPTPEEALEDEAAAHEADMTAALEEALESGSPAPAATPQATPPTSRKLDYVIKKSKRTDEGAAQKAAPSTTAEEYPLRSSGVAGTAPQAPDPQPQTSHATGQPALSPAPAEPKPRPNASRVAWSPDKTSRRDYKPVSKEGEALHLSMDKLREIVRKAEDRQFEQSTDWAEEQPKPTTRPPPVGLKLAKGLPDAAVAPPSFADSRDMPPLPEGAEWVGRQERRKHWEGRELREAGKEEPEEGEDKGEGDAEAAKKEEQRWRRPVRDE